MEVVSKDGALKTGETPTRAAASRAVIEPAPTLIGDLRSEGAPTQQAQSLLRSQLRILAILRGIGVVVQLSAIWVLSYGFDVVVPLPQFLGSASLLVVANALLVYRLTLPSPVSQREYFGHLMADYIWLTHTLYWTGGSASNPFADLYIVLVGLCALALSLRYAVTMAALSAAAYALLMSYNEPLHFAHTALSHEDAEDLAHGLHFLLACAVVAYFGYRFALVNRRYSEAVAAAREREAQRESALNLATLAAGTAHEMATPLTTMATIVNDLRRSQQLPTDLRISLNMVSSAIQACKRSLDDMVVAVGADHMPEHKQMPAAQFFGEVIQRFREVRPDVPVTTTIHCGDDARILAGCSLRQALLSLVCNAADASPQAIEIELRCTPTDIVIEVLDRGPGIPTEVRDKLGHAICSSKPATRGNGLGVFLATKTIERMGGQLLFAGREGGGTCARVTLPTVNAAGL